MLRGPREPRDGKKGRRKGIKMCYVYVQIPEMNGMQCIMIYCRCVLINIKILKIINGIGTWARTPRELLTQQKKWKTCNTGN